jgi:orotidine-5'-phosphate decarboxylase
VSDRGAAPASGPFTARLACAQDGLDSMLCVGLDPEPARFPARWAGDSNRILDFCRAIVDATADLACAYKPQIAYFAAHRAEDQLEDLIAHIRRTAPRALVILDAKRGDIGSTAERYAREAFERYRADAVTLSPYMGFDSLEPYLAVPDVGLILLCRTSNPGGADLQDQMLAASGDWPAERVFERVARLADGPWQRDGRLGLVVGATAPREIARVRELAPSLPLLIPGVGAQGGDAQAAVQAGWRARPGAMDGRIVVNSSRAILYASAGDDFADAARRVAADTREQLRTAALRGTDPPRPPAA